MIVVNFGTSFQGCREATMSEQRKLAAIFAADIVGFSRLTGIDEDGMLAQLRIAP